VLYTCACVSRGMRVTSKLACLCLQHAHLQSHIPRVPPNVSYAFLFRCMWRQALKEAVEAVTSHIPPQVLHTWLRLRTAEFIFFIFCFCCGICRTMLYWFWGLRLTRIIIRRCCFRWHALSVCVCVCVCVFVCVCGGGGCIHACIHTHTHTCIHTYIHKT